MPRPRSTISRRAGCRPGPRARTGAVERRDLDRRAERRQRRGHVDHRDQVLAVAQEALVLAHPHDDVEVAGRAAVLARVAAAREPDALAVGDARRDVDRDAARLAHDARAVALVAGRLGHAAVAAADVADRGAHELAERRARDALVLAGAVAVRQVTIGVPGSAPLPLQFRTAPPPRRRPRPVAVGGVGEVDRRGHDDVAALDPTAATAAAAAAEAVEPPPPPKIAENRSETEPKASMSGA